jgi:hypothetical protein
MMLFFVADGELFTALCASAGQNETTVLAFHTFTETMCVFPLPLMWLIRTFHLLLLS